MSAFKILGAQYRISVADTSLERKSIALLSTSCKFSQGLCTAWHFSQSRNYQVCLRSKSGSSDSGNFCIWSNFMWFLTVFTQ